MKELKCVLLLSCLPEMSALDHRIRDETMLSQLLPEKDLLRSRHLQLYSHNDSEHYKVTENLFRFQVCYF